ncbi:hypothetical protein FQ188_23505 [Rhodococcus sp. ANT_H53B]|nr:hypothetical protein FQ188_23505 [Rhodococcus sp. ANT_H53B]
MRTVVERCACCGGIGWCHARCRSKWRRRSVGPE